MLLFSASPIPSLLSCPRNTAPKKNRRRAQSSLRGEFAESMDGTSKRHPRFPYARTSLEIELAIQACPAGMANSKVDSLFLIDGWFFRYHMADALNTD